jgi:hypothetical protein
MTSRQALWARSRILKGLCGQCGRSKLVSKTRCVYCLKAMRKADRLRDNSKPWKAGGRGRVPVEKRKK